MQVYFDHQIFYLQRVGGISRYFVELATELNRIEIGICQISAPFHHNRYLTNYQLNNHSRSKPFTHPVFRSEIEGSEAILKKRLNHSSQRILHETYYTHRVNTRTPRVITIHDMIPEILNDPLEIDKRLIDGKRDAIRESAAIICVSQHTKEDLVRIYPESASKCVVVHHGVRPASVHPFNAAAPYILHVGNRGGYKNFKELLQTYSSEKEIHSEFDLIVFGGGEPTAAEQQMIAGSLKNKIKFLSGDDALLNGLYQHASVLVYISDYEGFGLPVLEAMVNGCPVICSDRTSLPEVAGDACEYVRPGTNSLAASLKNVLFGTDRRRSLVSLGQQRAALFTWEKCARETLSVYKKVLGD